MADIQGSRAFFVDGKAWPEVGSKVDVVASGEHAAGGCGKKERYKIDRIAQSDATNFKAHQSFKKIDLALQYCFVPTRGIFPRSSSILGIMTEIKVLVASAHCGFLLTWR